MNIFYDPSKNPKRARKSNAKWNVTMFNLMHLDFYCCVDVIICPKCEIRSMVSSKTVCPMTAFVVSIKNLNAIIKHN